MRKPSSLHGVTLWLLGGFCGVALAPRGRAEGALESSDSALDPTGHSQQYGPGPSLCVLQGIVRGHLSRTEAVVLSFSLKSPGKLRMSLCCSSGSHLSSSIKGSYNICFGGSGKEISSKESPLCVKQFAGSILFNLHQL